MGKLEEKRIGFYTSFEDIIEDLKEINVEVLDINGETLTITYEDEEVIEEVYDLHTIYRNDKVSTITIGEMRIRETL